MNSFNFSLPTTIIFGAGRRFDFVNEIKKHNASHVLIHFGGKSVMHSGLLATTEKFLDEAGIKYTEFGGVKPNPKVSLVREGVTLCRENKIDFVLACGCGSVIDSAKAIAAGVMNDMDIWDIMTQYHPIDSALPIGVVLTLPASASESGFAFVISNEETNQKVLWYSDAVRPKFAVIDPELYVTIPEKVYWPSICDMLSHVIERYFSPAPYTELTDGICEAVARNIIRNANRLLNGENNCDVWSELSISANIAHNGICGIGRLPDWCCHNIEHELSAIYDVTHGAGLTVITPAWMRYVYKDNIPLFAQFAIQIMGVEANTRNLEGIALQGIERLEHLYKSFGMPLTLSEIGITDETNFELMAKRAVGYTEGTDPKMGYMKELSWKDIVEIFRSVK